MSISLTRRVLLVDTSLVLHEPSRPLDLDACTLEVGVADAAPVELEHRIAVQLVGGLAQRAPVTTAVDRRHGLHFDIHSVARPSSLRPSSVARTPGNRFSYERLSASASATSARF